MWFCSRNNNKENFILNYNAFCLLQNKKVKLRRDFFLKYNRSIKWKLMKDKLGAAKLALYFND